MDEVKQQNNNVFIILIVVGIILLVGGAFFYFKGTARDEGTAMEETGENTSQEMMEHPASDSAMMNKDEASESSMMEETPDVTFEISGKNFEFSKKELTVKKGQTVKIVFTSESGTHDWKIDEFNTQTDIVSTGNTSEVTFTADKTGEFEYYCSVANHRAQGMVGTLTVTE